MRGFGVNWLWLGRIWRGFKWKGLILQGWAMLLRDYSKFRRKLMPSKPFLWKISSISFLSKRANFRICKLNQSKKCQNYPSNLSGSALKIPNNPANKARSTKQVLSLYRRSWQDWKRTVRSKLLATRHRLAGLSMSASNYKRRCGSKMSSAVNRCYRLNLTSSRLLIWISRWRPCAPSLKPNKLR
jgi:hypothetical protein